MLAWIEINFVLQFAYSTYPYPGYKALYKVA